MADDLIERLKATEGHAPGPWEAGATGECDYLDEVFCRATGSLWDHSICYPGVRDMPDEMIERTMGLIALAPEMKARIISDELAIDRLRVALAAAEARAETAERERDAAREALHRINDLAGAYPEDVFTPLNDDEVAAVAAAMSAAVSNGSDRMHASWGRHLMSRTGEIVRAALLAQPAPSETEGRGDG